MSTEYLKVQIDKAVDLVQVISEDVEDNFIGTELGRMVEARAAMTVSLLDVLTTYLKSIYEEAITLTN